MIFLEGLACWAKFRSIVDNVAESVKNTIQKDRPQKLINIKCKYKKVSRGSSLN